MCTDLYMYLLHSQPAQFKQADTMWKKSQLQVYLDTAFNLEVKNTHQRMCIKIDLQLKVL